MQHCMTNSVDSDQLASSSDLEQHCFQLSLYLVYTVSKECTYPYTQRKG